MVYNNKFFETKEEAQAFKKEKGYGVIYSGTKHSKTRHQFIIETTIALERGEVIDSRKTPWCVAWNESHLTGGK
ncbi:MAG: hypothetical protein IKH57_15750 [Clostridia bacterium]|nr:hypothetical protein [Clostridia bacterium]